MNFVDETGVGFGNDNLQSLAVEPSWLLPGSLVAKKVDNSTAISDKIKDSSAHVDEEIIRQEKELQNLYSREDAIRRETQQREDTAYQRAVADMRKAGIDPNLMTTNGASSGGGIVNASRLDKSSELSRYDLLKSLTIEDIKQLFERDENAKDRLLSIMTTLLEGAFDVASSAVSKKSK